MTMRLNLGSILKSQLRQPVTESTSRDLAFKQKATLRLGAENSTRYFPDKADVKSRVHSMMANIHQHMKSTTPPRKAVPTIPAAIAEIPTPPVSAKKSRRIKGGGVTGISSSKSPVIPISQIKARLNRQSQQVMRRGYSEIGPKSFTNQRRIREVLLQKTVLENMLLQHKRLQRDRQTIALDIQRMRQDLDRIKNKLDTSLQTLNSTRTLFTGFGKGKRGVQPISLPTNVNNDVAVSKRPIVSGKSKSSGAKQNKLGNVTMKRQHTVISKRRSRV